jgi:hypothetical protein
MIRLNMNDKGEPCVEQSTNRPSIYLDTWMWCRLSEDLSLKQNFLEAVKLAKPSIMYSIPTLFELAKIRDHAQLNEIITVMDSIDYGFLDTSGGDVIKRENASRLPDGTMISEEHPAADQDLMKLLFQITDPLKEFKVSRFVETIKRLDIAEIEILKEREEKLEGLTKSVLNARQDPAALERAKKRHKNKKIESKCWPYTKDIQRILYDFLVVNQTLKMNSNEWFDVWHTVVPIAYADFVLLDRRWCTFIRQNIPLVYPAIANVFMESELNMFFEDLKNFKA